MNRTRLGRDVDSDSVHIPVAASAASPQRTSPTLSGRIVASPRMAAQRQTFDRIFGLNPQREALDTSAGTVQLVKKYNQSSRLYINDEDDEKAPDGYTTVSKYFHAHEGREWTAQRPGQSAFGHNSPYGTTRSTVLANAASNSSTAIGSTYYFGAGHFPGSTSPYFRQPSGSGSTIVPTHQSGYSSHATSAFVNGRAATSSTSASSSGLSAIAPSPHLGASHLSSSTSPYFQQRDGSERTTETVPPVGSAFVTNDSSATVSPSIGSSSTSTSSASAAAIPSRYYLGSGDLSGPLNFVFQHWERGVLPQVTATTYDNDAEAAAKYPESYRSNRMTLEHMGAQVKNNVDATNSASMSPTRYDEVHFENPHTGVYGGSTESDARCVASNTTLMEGSMGPVKTKLNPGGRYVITEGNYPYRGSQGRTGMDLDSIATNAGFAVEQSENIGTQTVARTIGGTVSLPNSKRHRYRMSCGDSTSTAKPGGPDDREPPSLGGSILRPDLEGHL